MPTRAVTPVKGGIPTARTGSRAQSKKLSDLWALGALLVRLPVRAVGMPPLAGVAALVGTEILTHSRDTGEFR